MRSVAGTWRDELACCGDASAVFAVGRKRGVLVRFLLLADGRYVMAVCRGGSGGLLQLASGSGAAEIVPRVMDTRGRLLLACEGCLGLNLSGGASCRTGAGSGARDAVMSWLIAANGFGAVRLLELSLIHI